MKASTGTLIFAAEFAKGRSRIGVLPVPTTAQLPEKTGVSVRWPWMHI